MTKSSSSLVFIAVIILGLCSFTTLAVEKLDSTVLFYNIFKDWSSEFNKGYSIEEMAVRFYNWKRNYDFVQEHNSKSLSSKLTMNNMADLSSEEFGALHLGLNIDLDAKKTEKKNNTEKGTAYKKNETTTANLTNKTANTTSNKTANNTSKKNPLPKSVDWRSAGAVSLVKDQGQCGGCWAFAANGALEGLHAIKNKKLIDFSEQQMIDCAGGYGNQGCQGGLMTAAFNYTMVNGIQPENTYPYTAQEGYCVQDSKKVAFRNTGWFEITANRSDYLKAAVAKRPVAIGIEASSMTVQLFKSGVITAGCGIGLDHGVLIVGYDETKSGQGYWILKNSWGPNWGLNGYFHVAMGNQNGGAGVCGVNMMASYPTL